MNDDLQGRLVLVHPGLEHDPVNRQNHIGVISHADMMQDDVFVDFEGIQGLYASDALLVFMNIDEVHQNLADLAYETPFAELKALTQIDLFLRYGNANKEQMAMEIAKSYPVIQRFCLESLNDQLYRDIVNQYGRE